MFLETMCERVLEEIREDYENQALMERRFRTEDSTAEAMDDLGIFFARDDHSCFPRYTSVNS